MQDEQKIPEEKQGDGEDARRLGPVKWLCIITFSYLAALVVLSGTTSICAHPPLPGWGWSAISANYLSCRSLNELGDFLAGAFAPLAFVWVAGTVFIQSRELAAQRKELALTRQEYTLSRNIMQKELTIRNQKENDEAIEIHIDNIESILSRFDLYLNIEGEIYSGLADLNLAEMESREKKFAALNQRLSSLIDQIEVDQKIKIDARSFSFLGSLLFPFKAVFELRSDASLARNAALDRLLFDQTAATVFELSTHGPVQLPEQSERMREKIKYNRNRRKNLTVENLRKFLSPDTGDPSDW
jgi:hypothetical protein